MTASLVDGVWALGAVLLWASSSLVVSRGLSGLRSHNSQAEGILPLALDVAFSVLIATLSGATALAIVSGFDVQIVFDARVAAAGLLTFPVGTGLYYGATLAFRGRADVAAQFSNVKPLFSILIALVVFRESIGGYDRAAVVIVGLGVMLLVLAAALDISGGSWLPLVLGFALAASWSAGEGFVRASTVDVRALDVAFSGLAFSAFALAGLVASLAASGVARHVLAGSLLPSARHVPFLVHGVMSFGMAYALFFQSIAQIGLARSVTFTSLWPALAFAMGSIARRRSGAASAPSSPVRALGFALLPVGAFVGALG